MAVVIVLVVVVLAVVGGAVVFVKARAAAAADRAGTGANEILRSPPTSFPSDRPLTPLGLPSGVETATVRDEGTSPAGSATTEGVASPAASTPEPGAAATTATPDTPDDEAADEAAAARFRAPGTRARPATAPDAGTDAPPMSSGYPLEPVTHPLEPADAPEPSAEADEPSAEATERPEPSIEAAERLEPADAPEPSAEAGEAGEDEPVIDLDAISGAGEPADEAAWRDLVLQPEPDAVDHVLQALINRARFKQVGVEEVATELVERADLRGEEVSDVLAELVGRAEDATPGQARSSELVLFNDEVPSRPGQLTDFARLSPADKKRIIIRVLCLLVARSEDQQLPPRVTSDGATTSWPLARAVWPVASSDDAEVVLPSRLAKSG